MAMKPVVKFLAIAGVFVATNVSYASNHWAFDPYLGMEYKLGYTQGNSDWKRLLPTTKVHQNGTVFAGVKFHDYLAAEMGYSQSLKLSKDSNVAGFYMFNGTATAGTAQVVKLRYSNWIFDLNGQFPAHKSLSLLGTIGVESTKPKLDITNLGNAANNVINTIASKRKVAPRLGVGVQYVMGMFGVRSRVMWENTARVRFNNGSYTGAGTTEVSNKPFKNSYVWSIGAFVRW